MTCERSIDGFRLRDDDNHVLFEPVIDMLATSIQETGVIMPIKIDTEGYVVDGYHRLAAAKVLGMKRVPYEVQG